MSLWTWSLVAVGAFLLLYAAFVLVLVVAGRRESARALAGFIPDCVVLCGRLLGDPSPASSTMSRSSHSCCAASSACLASASVVSAGGGRALRRPRSGHE
jgi:hypothetical protein